MLNLSPVYKPCAQENGVCSFVGKQSVAYAAPDGTGSIFYRNLTNGTPCNATVFGDPSPGHQKACYVTPIPADVIAGGMNGNPIGWTLCAQENGKCDTGVPHDVLYGAAGSYVYANTGNTPCSNEIFGDPKIGSNKFCFSRQSGQFTPTIPPTISSPNIIVPVPSPSGPPGPLPTPPTPTPPPIPPTPLTPPHIIVVPPPEPNTAHKWTKGEIAGIVIAVIAVLIVIIALVAYGALEYKK